MGMLIGQHELNEIAMIQNSLVFPGHENQIVFDPLINCLIKHESGGKTNVYGDRGKAYGILQFWKGTFHGYKTKYGLEKLEYKNPDHQIIRADRMLQDDISNLKHWTTAKFCKKEKKEALVRAHL